MTRCFESTLMVGQFSAQFIQIHRFYEIFWAPKSSSQLICFSRGKPLVWPLARHFYSTTYGFQPVFFFPFDTLQRTQWSVTDSLLEFEYIELSHNASKMSKERL